MSMPKVTMIALERLHPHPKNSNVMAARTMKKLARHMERSGRYEPLVVRPHPEIAGDFQLINGHHRAKILRQLEHAEAACIVWELDDEETLLLLATINRLGGEDAPGKRLSLLETLAGSLRQSAADMAALLPEEADVLAKLLTGEKSAAPIAAAPLPEMEEAFTVFLKAGEKRALVAALAKTDANPAVALMRWAGRMEELIG
jgi:ParB-like chromosome segregation protein Spo0J